MFSLLHMTDIGVSVFLYLDLIRRSVTDVSQHQKTTSHLHKPKKVDSNMSESARPGLYSHIQTIVDRCFKALYTGFKNQFSEELVRRAGENDQEAIAELYNRTYSSVYYIIPERNLKCLTQSWY